MPRKFAWVKDGFFSCLVDLGWLIVLVVFSVLSGGPCWWSDLLRTRLLRYFSWAQFLGFIGQGACHLTCHVKAFGLLFLMELRVWLVEPGNSYSSLRVTGERVVRFIHERGFDDLGVEWWVWGVRFSRRAIAVSVCRFVNAGTS